MQLDLARFRAADSARFSNAWDVSRNLSKDVKTTCGFVNIAKKAKIAPRKLEKKGCIPPQVGVCGSRNFQQFCFFYSYFGYKYARKSFEGSKDADFA